MFRQITRLCCLALVGTTLFAQTNSSRSKPAQSLDPEVEKRVDSILSRMTPEQKIDLLGGVRSFYIRGYKELGWPELKMSDGPVGVRNYGPSTTMGGIGLAASWNPELVERMAKVLGEDCRARGVHFLLGPGVNIHRAPMNGRNFEYFGEDPFLAARTAVAYVKGVQSQGVIATIKHYMGNNSEYDRHNTDSEIDERTMREIYLPTFESAVKEAHVGAVMDSYNLINGEHATQNSFINLEVANKDWGFDGIIMSDWSATYDGVAAANNGLDLEMPSGKFMNRETLLPAIQSGKVSQQTIDDHVRRILRTAIRFGFLDREQTNTSIPKLNPEGGQVALEAARESFVLLKNEGNILPLHKANIKTIAVIGPDAFPAQPVGGGSAHVQPFHAVSYLEGLTNYLSGAGSGGAKVLYHAGLKPFREIADATDFTTDENNGEAGLRSEEFDNMNLSGSPVHTHVDRHVNFGSESYDAATGTGSIRWTGYYTAHTSGPHDFFVLGPGENGGWRLFVDEKPVADNWERATAILNFGTLSLEQGSKHKVRLEYYRRNAWGPKRVSLGVLPTSEAVDPAAKQIASSADAVLLFPGFDATIETEGGGRTFRLPPGQDELIKEITAANKKTIVVLTAGGNVDMAPWIDQVPALMHGWYSGEQGGTALAQLVFGDYNPSGRLPISLEKRLEDNAAFNSYYPNDGPKRIKYSEGVFVGYRHFDHDNIKPLFPFGFGLSYTTFAYKNLAISPATANFSGSPVTVSFDVTNTGSRAGADVAQVYVGDPHNSVPRPPKELKGFSKVYLIAGETKHVSIPLDARALSYYDVKSHSWKADPGVFNIYVGQSDADIKLEGKLTYRPTL
ncbi:MAG TPA: glycoside hydrolase family 3 C-terminal domain-containing protein [Terriglobales bacterium]|nr:glycoside hydrolase family 3 C-terminal domain-containing protein [Terriglobales bacterium]